MLHASLKNFQALSVDQTVTQPCRRPNGIELHQIDKLMTQYRQKMEGPFPLREMFRHSSAELDGITLGLSVIDKLPPRDRILGYEKSQRIVLQLADKMVKLFEKSFPGRTFARELLDSSHKFHNRRLPANKLDSQRLRAHQAQAEMPHIINAPRYALDLVFLASYAATCSPLRLLKAIHLYMAALDYDAREAAHQHAGLYRNSMLPAPDAIAKGDAAREQALAECQRLLVNTF